MVRPHDFSTNKIFFMLLMKNTDKSDSLTVFLYLLPILCDHDPRQ